MEYQIVSDPEVMFVEDAVADFTKDGWVPQGGIAVTLADSRKKEPLMYAQAMVREDE